MMDMTKGDQYMDVMLALYQSDFTRIIYDIINEGEDADEGRQTHNTEGPEKQVWHNVGCCTP